MYILEFFLICKCVTKNEGHYPDVQLQTSEFAHTWSSKLLSHVLTAVLLNFSHLYVCPPLFPLCLWFYCLQVEFLENCLRPKKFIALLWTLIVTSYMKICWWFGFMSLAVGEEGSVLIFESESCQRWVSCEVAINNIFLFF